MPEVRCSDFVLSSAVADRCLTEQTSHVFSPLKALHQVAKSSVVNTISALGTVAVMIMFSTCGWSLCPLADDRF